MTHKKIIDLCNKHGGSWTYKKQHEKEKPVYTWAWNLSMIRLYIPRILVFMKFKKDQGQIILKASTFCKGTKQNKEQLKKLRRKLKALHHKAYPLLEKYRKMH